MSKTTTQPVVSRRAFLMGCSAAIAAMAGARVTNVAFADPNTPDDASGDILITVFLRGGWDALNVVVPVDGTDRGNYVAARPVIKIPVTGQGAALRINNNGFSSLVELGLHPSMAPLVSLYQAGHLAFVPAAGLMSDTRSHFDAMQFMELGTPGIKATASGWITRHLASAPWLNTPTLIDSLASGGGQPMSLSGSTSTAALTGVGGFNIGGYWKYSDLQQAALAGMYSGPDWLAQAGRETLDTIDAINRANPGNYSPANRASYPGGGFGDSLKMIAQLIKINVGLRAATVDLGGWDTHEHQGTNGGGYLSGQVDNLARGLKAFFTDLNGCGTANFAKRTTIVTMSEFGRRVQENASEGTDHGHGSTMLVLGGGVNGGKIYGQWPGLATAQLYDKADLAVTTDYRSVLSEIITTRLANPNVSTVFPGFAPMTLGLAKVGAVNYPCEAPRQAFLPGIRR